MTTSYFGYVSRLAYLKSERQLCLERAEWWELRVGEGNRNAEGLRERAARLMAEIAEERAKERLAPPLGDGFASDSHFS